MTCYLRLFYSDIRFMNTIQRASRLSAATRKYIYMKLIYVCVKPLSFRNAVSCWGCVYSFSSWRREHRLMWCLRRRPSGESSYQHADHPTLYFPLPVFLPGVTLLPHSSRLMINFFFFFFYHFSHHNLFPALAVCRLLCCRASPSSLSVSRPEKMEMRKSIFDFRSPGEKNSHF